MTSTPKEALKPRKKPVQERASVTVEAIAEATIQVLLQHGIERLTTTRVAERAGVSVGTLYQYYPNKQSLLYAVLEQHLLHVAAAVEDACRENQKRTLEMMIDGVVDAFVDAKTVRVDVSMALYAIAGELNGAALVTKMSKRLNSAFIEMLKTNSRVSQLENLQFKVLMIVSAMGGSSKAVLEAGASPKLVQSLRRELKCLIRAYLEYSSV